MPNTRVEKKKSKGILAFFITLPLLVSIIIAAVVGLSMGEKLKDTIPETPPKPASIITEVNIDEIKIPYIAKIDDNTFVIQIYASRYKSYDASADRVRHGTSAELHRALEHLRKTYMINEILPTHHSQWLVYTTLK